MKFEHYIAMLIGVLQAREALMNVPLDCLGGMVLLIVLFVILADPR